MVVAKTLDYTQAEEEITSLTLTVRGEQMHGVSAFPVKSFFHKIGKICRKQFRLSRVAERSCEGAREERSHLEN